MAEVPKDNATSAKCFSSIFQRLVCGGSLPTHPSDQLKAPNETTFDHFSSQNKLPFRAEAIISSNKVTANSPGIVARLMGLDSLPQEKCFSTSFDSYPRSRSVNSLDCMMNFNLTEQFHHRRVRTSVSFREIPNSCDDQELKSSEFVVFCFNDEEEKKQGFSIRRSNKMGNQEKKLKKGASNTRQSVQKKGEFKKVDDVAKSLSNNVSTTGQKKDTTTMTNPVRSHGPGQKKDVCGKQNNHRIGNKVKKQVECEDYPRKIMSVESKVEKKKKKRSKSKIQPLFNSADSSPIHQPQQGATPAENKSKIQPNSRKSPARVTNTEHAITSKVEKQKEINKETDHYIKVLGEICRLTEEELNKSCWVATRAGGSFNFEDIEDTCLHFGQEVLELLVDQVVHELLLFAH